MTHTHWLCGVVWQRGGGIEGLLQLFLRRICFGWPTEDVSLDFSLPVGIFFFCLSRQKNWFSLHLSRSLLMVFDGLGGVSKKCCSPGGMLECFFFCIFPLSFGYLWAGWHPAHHNHLSSASSALLSGILFLSLHPAPFFFQFVSESVSCAAPAVFNPISALILCPASITFAYVM